MKWQTTPSQLFEGSGSFCQHVICVNRQRWPYRQRSARGIAHASRNKSVPDFVHAPYPLRLALTGRDDHRRRGMMSSGAGSDLIAAGLLPYPSYPIKLLRLAWAIPLAGRAPIGKLPDSPFSGRPLSYLDSKFSTQKEKGHWNWYRYQFINRLSSN
jgi:hypothetical protein